MFKSRLVIVPLIAASVAACNKPAPPVSEARPVRAVTVEQRADGEIVSLTGQVRAKDEVNLAFRLDGRMIERPVHVGDKVAAGQVIARLDPQIQQNALNVAEANLASVAGGHDAGASRLLAAAGAVQGRLGDPRQLRRRRSRGS